MSRRIISMGLFISLIMFLCLLSFQLGKMNARAQIVTKQVEVIKYVEKKKAIIYSRPNADRVDLLQLMHAGIL